jgi:anti-sigma B factor antagonist
MSLAEEFEVREDGGFEIRISDGGDRYIIQPRGDLDLATKDELHEALRAALDRGAKTVLLDLSGLTFIDSSGIGVINLGVRMASERRREFVLRRGQARIQRIFEVTGIADRLPFID